MFEMVRNCYDLRHVFEFICNADEFQNRLNDLKLSDLDWRDLKSVTDFLEVMAEYTTASSGQSYATLPMPPLIYDSLVSHCRDTIDGRAQTGFTTLACQNAAQSVLEKVSKNESYLCSPLTRWLRSYIQESAMDLVWHWI